MTRLLAFLLICGAKVAIESLVWHAIQKSIDDPKHARIQCIRVKNWVCNKKFKHPVKYHPVDMSNIDNDLRDLYKENGYA